MKAIILEEPGGIEYLKASEIEKPVIKEGEVLVKVKAISINPVDIKTRSGKAVYEKIKSDSPVILGWDISGEVVETASDVSEFKEGDQVFGMVNFPGHGKAYAEYVAAPANHLAKKPDHLTHEDAAAATLAALTAWQVLVHQTKVKKGDKVLIHAAAGGVGHFAIQIAKHFGAYVIGTASKEKESFLKEMGADEPFDYKAQNFEDVLKDVDITLDPLGGEVTKRSYSVLKPGGKLVSIVGGVKEEDKNTVDSKNLSAENYLVHSSGEDMKELAILLHSGAIKPQVSKVFTLDQIAEAHKQIETGRTIGKVVINI